MYGLSFPTTLSDHQGHLLIASFNKIDFLYSYVAVDKISTGFERCASLQLSLLFDTQCVIHLYYY